MEIPQLAFMAGIAAFWNQIQAFIAKAGNLVVVSVRFEEDAAQAINSYLWHCLPKGPSWNQRFFSAPAYVRPHQRYEKVALEAPALTARLFFYRSRPVWLSALKYEPNGQSHISGSNDNGACTLRFFRGTVAVEALVAEAMVYLNERQQLRHSGAASRYRLYRWAGRSKKAAFHMGVSGESAKGIGGPPAGPDATADNAYRLDLYKVIGWDREQLGEEASATPLRVLSYSNEVLGLLRDIQTWCDSEKWYRERGIIWSKGAALLGKPGTGKTAFVRATAQILGWPIFSFELGTMDNSELVEHWSQLLERAPAIALFEDIDTVFEGRKNVVPGSELTFDCLLNCIGGVQPAEGILTMVTTNRPELMDDALGTVDGRGVASRPGRIDRIVTFGLMDEDCRRSHALVVLKDWPEEIERIVREGDTDTGAQFADRCATRALQLFNKHE